MAFLASAEAIKEVLASAAGQGVGSAAGAGTAAAASAANHQLGAEPLLGTDGDCGWFWMIVRHFVAAADRYPSPQRRMQRGGSQAPQLMRQHQD
ncbi:hypothetical protein HXX76_004252 [Chlamydomonas incerta]|uniref:Uncharacterized protein n=1 Tax=Chlamydomonas incerta TaxID=51695 RepID=A0A835T799_CHLIN|nr:hypothetical protein HXX76_004252 [Chlamydomonas incerta]|eukprot:KAG2440139.1 hypothetical protein HXX76_004252 [Chlamydomonas incerta]